MSFQPDSCRAKVARSQGLAFTDASNRRQILWRISSRAQRQISTSYRKVHSEWRYPGSSHWQALFRHAKRLCDFPCFCSRNDCKATASMVSLQYWLLCEFWQRKLDLKRQWCLVAIRNWFVLVLKGIYFQLLIASSTSVLLLSVILWWEWFPVCPPEPLSPCYQLPLHTLVTSFQAQELCSGSVFVKCTLQRSLNPWLRLLGVAATQGPSEKTKTIIRSNLTGLTMRFLVQFRCRSQAPDTTKSRLTCLSPEKWCKPPCFKPLYWTGTHCSNTEFMHAAGIVLGNKVTFGTTKGF